MISSFKIPFLRSLSTSPFSSTVENELNPVFDVAARIVRNVTEMQATKMLHVYCGGNFVDFFGEVSHHTTMGLKS